VDWSFDHLTSPLTWQLSSMCTSSDSVHTWFNMYDLKWSQVIQAIFKNKFHDMSTYNRKSIQSYPVYSAFDCRLRSVKRLAPVRSAKFSITGLGLRLAHAQAQRVWLSVNSGHAQTKYHYIIIMNWWIIWPIWHNMNILYIGRIIQYEYKYSSTHLPNIATITI
jgi:hypothetical protein